MKRQSQDTTNTFRTSYDSLNDAQRCAVDTIEGPVVVIAGPGTGKTTVLTLRIANILQKTDTPPDAILALTFTESGAHNMRRKLTEIIGAAAYRVNIHTFHGFAARIIEKYPDYFPRIIGSTIINEIDQTRIVEQALKSKKIKLLRPYGDRGYYVRPILKEIQNLKRENISPEEFADSIVSPGAIDDAANRSIKASHEKQTKQYEKNTELAMVYAYYERAMAEGRFYDFDDMLLEIIRAMRGYDDFKLMLQEEYQYILADEHQDANAAQNRILELLSDFHESPNLFIVGDDKQAIYRFQGASLDNFMYFKDKYKTATVIDLEHNYRSHQGILDASHSIIVNNPTIPGHDAKPLRSLQIGSMPISIDVCEDRDTEIGHIADSIADEIANGKDPQGIAVLYRDNKHAEPISRAFKDRGVEYHIESDHDILGESDIVGLVTLLRSINNPSTDDELALAMFLPVFGNDPGEVAEASKRARREGAPIYKVLKNFPKLRDSYARISKWNTEAQTMPFLQFLHKIIEEAEIIKMIIEGDMSAERLHDMRTFIDYAEGLSKTRHTYYLRNFIEHIDIAGEHGISTKRASHDNRGVRMMTAHRAKGLEFDSVYIVHANDGIWGNRSGRNYFHIPSIEHMRNVGRIEDERRLFYVAMTRARERVCISYALGDGESDMVPSQFIEEIRRDLIEVKQIRRDTESLISIYLGGEDEEFRDDTSVLDREFVRTAFLAQPLSVTHINNYISCPWKYFFTNLIRIPEAKDKHQMYGTAIHATLKTFFDTYRDGREMTKKQLLDVLRHNMSLEAFAHDELAETIEKGRRALGGYYDAYKGSWTRNFVTEYAIRGIAMEIPDANGDSDRTLLQLTGKLDRMVFLDETNISVIDYKTGKPKSKNEIMGKTKNSDGNYWRQLVFYKYILSLDRPESYMQNGEIDFIEPNESGKYKNEIFEIKEGDVEALKKQIVAMASEILGMKFIGKKCNDRKCKYCAMGESLAIGKRRK